MFFWWSEGTMNLSRDEIKETILSLVQKKRQSFSSIISHLGYVPMLSDIIKELEREGKVKLLFVNKQGNRLFVCRPDYNENNLYKETHIQREIKKREEWKKQKMQK